MKANPRSMVRAASSASISRRQFLRRTATAAAFAGLPLITPSKALGQPAPGNSPLRKQSSADTIIRIGQIGCGRIANGMDLPGILKHHQLARIVAVCDPDSKRASMARDQVKKSYAVSLGEAPGVEVAKDYHALLARDDIDAVVISTPEHGHAELIIDAALSGRDIFVQKPLTLTLAEGRVASDIVRDHKRVLQVGSQQRSTEQFVRACTLVRNGRIGKLHTVRIGLPTDPSGGNAARMPVPENLDYEMWLGCLPEVYYTEDRVHPQNSITGRPGWLRRNQTTCGMITGWGSHHVDIAHWGMDTEYTGPISVKGEATWPGPDSFWDVHGKYSLELRYANRVTLLINDEFPNGIRFEGEEGWVWVSRGNYSATASDPTSGAGTKPLDASNPQWLTEDLGDLEIQLHHSPRWDHHLDWLTAIRQRTEPATNVETGHRSGSACILSWIAMKLGRAFDWDPATERSTDAEVNEMLRRPEREGHGALNRARAAGYTFGT